MSATTEVQKKALDDVFPDKISLECFLEDVEESLRGHRVREKEKRQKILDFIKNNVSEEVLPEENFIPQFTFRED